MVQKSSKYVGFSGRYDQQTTMTICIKKKQNISFVDIYLSVFYDFGAIWKLLLGAIK